MKNILLIRKASLFLFWSFALLVFPCHVFGQVSLTNVAPAATINFSVTVSGVTNGAYTGSGFQATPAAGQLDSDAWAVTGWSNGSLAFGGTQTTAATDYTRGATAVVVSTGGFYSYTGAPGSVGNPSFLIQPGGTDFAPGTMTLRIVNNGTSNLTELSVSYNLFIRNDQGRSSTFNFSHSTDNSTYTPIAALDYSSPVALDALGYVIVGSAPSRTTTISGINIAPGSFVYIRWSSVDNGGSGSRDEIGLDDIVLTGTYGVILTTPTVTTTTPPSAITLTSATLAGNVTATGGSDILGNGIVYSTTDPTPTIGEPGVIQLINPTPNIGTGSFSISTGSILFNDTPYNYSSYAINAQGTSYGTPATFSTLANIPLQPDAAVNVTTTSFDFGFDTSNNPSNTQYAIQINGQFLQANGFLGATAVWQNNFQWQITPVPHLITVFGLTPNALYTYAIKARNGDNTETAFGTANTVTTSPLLTPSLAGGTLTGFGNVCINTTSGVNGFTLTGTNLDGSNVTIGPLANYTFDSGSGYGPTASISGYGSAFSTTINVKFTPIAALSYDGSIPVSGGNAPAISVAVTGSGVNTPASVTTVGSSSITASTATITGTIIQACSAIITSGMEYSTASDLSGSIQVSNPANLSGLAPNTQYYFRAYATDDTGTVNGLILTFTTSQLPAPGVLAANPISYDSFTANWSAVSGADDYQLDVSTSPTFSSQINTTGLFISEYGEGSGGNKKYIEIYNGTGASVNLANYQVWGISNGGTWTESTLTLSGTLLNNDVYVIASNSTDVIGADLYVTPINSAPFNFNGDDAIGIAYNGGSGIVFTLIDAVGTDGIDPGAGWAVAGTTNATVDKILIRKPTILSANTNWVTSAGTNTSDSEWIVSSFAYNATNQTTDLGLHTINNSTPSFIVENLTVAGTSFPVTGLSANTNYYYRVRAHSAASTSPNSTVVSVTTTAAPPTFGSIVQGAGDACENSNATFEISGLLPNRSFIIYYTINGNPFTSAAISSNLSGTANLEVAVVLINNGQTLEVTQVEDVVSTLVFNPTMDNTATISVLANVTYYRDFDNDTYGDLNTTIESCSGVPGGYVSDSTDCDDNDDTKHTTFSFYADADLDGVGFGSIQSGVCAVDANTPPSGYSLTDTDCAPGDGTAWQTGLFFVDADGDNYSPGLATTTFCYGITEPTGFSLLNLGLDCDDTITAINPGQPEVLYDAVDNNCDGSLDEGFQITTPMIGCGATLASISSLISALSSPATLITGYRFEVTRVGSSPLEVQVIDKTTHYFNLTQLPLYAYAATYSVKCMLQRNGIWLGYYGPACNISSPAVLDPGGSVAVTPSQCGITIPTISTLIATTSLAGVTGYKFRVTNLRTGFVQELPRTLHWFSLNMLTQYVYGDIYSVEVAVKTTGITYSGYGAPCNVTAPPVPSLTSQCGTIIPAKSTNIVTASLNLVTSYDFEVRNETTLVTANVSNNLNWFRLSMLPNYAASTQFRVRVRVLTSGVFSDYGDACFITSPAVARTVETVSNNVFEVTASPNPFDNNFGMFLNSTSTEDVSIRVYDMIGKLVEQREVKSGDVVIQEIGARFPSGVYNVIVTQGTDVKTLRVIKR